MPAQEECKQSVSRTPEQDVAPVPQWDSYYSECIEETIDELERRIKAEEARFAQLTANRRRYEQWLEPDEVRYLFRHEANRLVNFDPNFDLPDPEPLPQPWLHCRRAPYHYSWSPQRSQPSMYQYKQ